MKLLRNLKPGILACLITLLATQTAHAQLKRDRVLPMMSSVDSRTIAAEVVAVDMENRRVTIKQGDDETLVIPVSEQTRGLSAVSVGDVLVAEYQKITTIRLAEPEGELMENADTSAEARSMKGEMPSYNAEEKRVRVAFIEQIDKDAATLVVRDQNGEQSTLPLRNPRNIEFARIGDRVVYEIEETITVNIEDVPTQGEE